MNKRLIFSIIALFLTLCVADTALAAKGIAVDPPVIEISLAEGENHVDSYKVANFSEQEVDVTVEPVDWQAKYLKRESTADVNDWLYFPQKKFSIPPKKAALVQYELLRKSNVEGEQVAQVYFGFTKKGAESLFKTRYGVILYLGDKGKENLNSKIVNTEFSYQRSEGGKGDLIARINIDNSGESHVRPHGKIVVYDKDSNQVAEITIKKHRGIYSKASATIDGKVKDVSLPKGEYTAEIEIDCGMYGVDNICKSTAVFSIE